MEMTPVLVSMRRRALAVFMLLPLLIAGCGDPLGLTARTQIQANADIAVAEAQAEAEAVKAEYGYKSAAITSGNMRSMVTSAAIMLAVVGVAWALASVRRAEAQAPKAPQITVIMSAGSLPPEVERLTLPEPQKRQDNIVVVQK